MREFKVNGIKVSIVDRFNVGKEISRSNPKYEVKIFDSKYDAWRTLCTCMTLREGRELAEEMLG